MTEPGIRRTRARRTAGCARLAACLGCLVLTTCARQAPSDRGSAARSTPSAPAQRASADTTAPPSPPPTFQAPAPATSGGLAIVIGVNGELPGTTVAEPVATRLREAGGMPLRLYPGGATLDAVDALVLVGGADIDPSQYDEARQPHTKLISAERERFDLRLAADALERGLPILGICLGAQELWVSHHGALVQDIPSEVGHQVDHRARSRGHWVSLTPGSKLVGIYGMERLLVFSNHHQAVDGAAHAPTDFALSARSEDGVVEGFETRAQGRFVIGVNWHPEQKDEERVLFEALVHAARARKAAQLQATVPGRKQSSN